MKSRWSLRSQRPLRLLMLPDLRSLARITSASSEAPRKQHPIPRAKKSKKSQRPAWATTPKQEEDAKEAEVDDLIEFAYDLDYEKYMEDYEVR